MVFGSWHSGEVVVAENLLWIFRRKHVNRVTSAWTSVCLSRPSEPPYRAENANKRSHANGIVHIVRAHGLDCWEKEHNADERDPGDCDRIHRFAPFAHCVWSRVEHNASFVPPMGNDDRNVTDIQCGSRDVENSSDGQGTTNANEIQAAAEGNHEPDSVDWSMSKGVNLAPESVLSLVLAPPFVEQLLTQRTERLHHEKMPTPFSHSPTWQSSQ